MLLRMEVLLRRRRFDTNTNVVDVQVGHLRKKVAALGARPVIQTIRGSGYRFG
jgi:two-component system OmpR family response regulator